MADAYKNIARWYDNIFEPLNHGFRKVGLKMYPAHEGMSVLDIGCGTGAHLKLYQDKKCKIYGLDSSPAMINEARKKLGDDADLRLIKANRMPFAEQMFDIITCMTVLHEMDPQVRIDTLSESRRVLKDDGRIILIDFQPGPVKPVKGWISKIIIFIAEMAAGGAHFRNFRQFMRTGGLAQLLIDTGLRLDNKRILSGGTFAIYVAKK